MNPWIDVFGWSIVGACVLLIVLVEIPHIARVVRQIRAEMEAE